MIATKILDSLLSKKQLGEDVVVLLKDSLEIS